MPLRVGEERLEEDRPDGWWMVVGLVRFGSRMEYETDQRMVFGKINEQGKILGDEDGRG